MLTYSTTFLRDKIFIHIMNVTENVTGIPMMTPCLAPGGERWWVWLVTSGVIYVCGLLFSSLAYAIYYIVKKKSSKKNEVTEKNKVASSRFTDQQKPHSLLSPRHWRKIAQQLISGDTIPSKLLITFTLLLHHLGCDPHVLPN